MDSIEDLMHSPKGSANDESTQAKFSARQKEIKIKERERLTKGRADDLGLPYINLVGFPVSPDALILLSEEEARKLSAICFFYDGNNLRLGVADSPDEQVLEKIKELSARYHAEPAIYLISEHSLNHALGLYKAIPKPREFVRGVKIGEEELNKYSEQFSTFKQLQEQVDNAPITEIVSVIMAAAIKSGASDIHIEGEEDNIKVRFRVDGILLDVINLDKDLWKKTSALFRSIMQ